MKNINKQNPNLKATTITTSALNLIAQQQQQLKYYQKQIKIQQQQLNLLTKELSEQNITSEKKIWKRYSKIK